MITKAAGIRYDGVAEQLERQLGEERADAAGEVRRGGVRARAEEPDGVGRLVAGERDDPDERGGEQRDADELADAARNVDPLTSQISMMTGSTNGRRPERLRKKRRSSTRSFSLISP